MKDTGWLNTVQLKNILCALVTFDISSVNGTSKDTHPLNISSVLIKDDELVIVTALFNEVQFLNIPNTFVVKEALVNQSNLAAPGASSTFPRLGTGL